MQRKKKERHEKAYWLFVGWSPAMPLLAFLFFFFFSFFPSGVAMASMALLFPTLPLFATSLCPTLLSQSVKNGSRCAAKVTCRFGVCHDGLMMQSFFFFFLLEKGSTGWEGFVQPRLCCLTTKGRTLSPILPSHIPEVRTQCTLSLNR